VSDRSTRPAGDTGRPQASDRVGVRRDAAQLLAALRALRGAPRDTQYWALLADCLLQLCRARVAMISLRSDDGAWLTLARVQADEAGSEAHLNDGLALLAPRALTQGQAHSPLPGGGLIAAVSLINPAGPTLALFELGARDHAAANELLFRAQLVADLPSPVEPAPAPADALTAVSAGVPAVPVRELVALVDIVAQVMHQQTFGAASLALVNLFSAALGADQAALGIGDDGLIKVAAISHIDRFERKAENVHLLESAMEEAVDQEVDLVYPALEDDSPVTLAHDRLSRMLGYESLATVVVRDESGRDCPPMALLLAREGGSFEPTQIQQLSIALHLLQPWLAALRQDSRWWGARAWSGLRRGSRRWLSPEKPGRKLLALAAILIVLGASLGTWPYRVDGSAELATDSVQVISAPFDGHLAKVSVTLADTVAADALMAQMDVRELELQASDLVAEVRRYEAEADRARATGQKAETQIAMARVVQARARLERVRYLLAQAQVRAPFAGVVVEGERKELTGLPMRQGDKLFRLARIESLYAVILVSERDAHHLPEMATGRLRLLSQPDREIGFRVVQVVPIAQARGSQGGQIQLRAELEEAQQSWWRPGMAGLARIDAGERRILWIWTHRLIDTIRLKLWW